MKISVKTLIPWFAAACALNGAALAMRPDRSLAGFDLAGFARLPVLEGGRIKPVDSVARNSLLVIRGKQSIPLEGREVGPDEWLLDVLFRPAIAQTQLIFNVDDPDVLGLLDRRQTSSRYLAYQDLMPHLDEIQKQGQAAHALDAKKRTRFQSAIANLYDRVLLYYRLSNTVHLGEIGLGELIATRAQAGAADQAKELMNLAVFRPLPPRPGEAEDAWKNVGEALVSSTGGPVDPRLVTLAALETSWGEADGPAFNRAVADAEASFNPRTLRHSGYEAIFNRAEPFYLGMVIYVLALFAIFFSWLLQPVLLRKTG
jgi:hypothetical protein